MARQPKRSAFGLTINSLTKNQYTLLRIILLISTNFLINLVRSDDNILNNNNNNFSGNSNYIINLNSNYSGNNLTTINTTNISNNTAGTNQQLLQQQLQQQQQQQQQQPKFGDRLLPRNRQFNGSINQTIGATVQNSFKQNSLSKILDSFNSNINNNNNSIHDINHFLNSSSVVNTLNNNNNNNNFYDDRMISDNLNHFHVTQNDKNDDSNDDGDSDGDVIDYNRSKSNSIKYFSNNSSDHNNRNNRHYDDSNLWWISDHRRSNKIGSRSGMIGSNNNSNSSSSSSSISGSNSNSHSGMSSSLSSSDDDNQEDEFDAIVHDVVVIPSVIGDQQHQELRRRNDYDIDRNYIIDHMNTNVSKADRLIEMSTEFFIIPTSTAMNPQDIANQHHQQSRNFNDQQQQQHNIRGAVITPHPVLILGSRNPTTTNNLSVTPPSIITSSIYMDGLRKEPWVVPVLVFASLSMILMAAFEIFVLFKAWRTSPSRRHLFLGQMLLLGLFACAGLGAVLSANPTILSCATVRFGVGVAYALVFAALLVKCVFLISLNGGVYLPAPYQGLLLLFAVLIQVAIGAQWLMTQPPDIHTLTVPIGPNIDNKFSMLITSTDIQRVQGTTVISLCKTQFSEFLLSLVYVVFLIIFVTVLAIKSRGIRDNYRESTYIGLAIGGAIPIWLGWTLCGLAVADRHKDACIAFGLIATSSTVFLVMFMPKGRQLAAMGKEGLYVEDREDQFSSLSRAGSGYSPSFFHFKPIKYGVMGHNMQNSTTNTTNLNGGIVGGGCNTGNSVKHQNNGVTLGGDRVALVAAGPPSYTRMYHYFPAHLTHPFCFYPTPPPPQPLSPPLSPLKAIGSHTPTSAHIAQTMRYPGLFMRPDETNVYTTLEPTLSSNPNVYFQRSGGVHPGMMY